MAAWEARRESISTSPNSFLSKQRLYVGGSCGSRESSRVVLPEPRKPVMMVTGVGGALVIAGEKVGVIQRGEVVVDGVDATGSERARADGA